MDGDDGSLYQQAAFQSFYSTACISNEMSPKGKQIRAEIRNDSLSLSLSIYIYIYVAENGEVEINCLKQRF